DGSRNDTCCKSIQKFSSSGYKDIIGQHIAASHDQSAAKKVGQNVSGKKTAGTENKGKDCPCSNIGKGSLCIHHPHVTHIGKSCQEKKLAGLSHSAGNFSQKHLKIGISRPSSCFYRTKNCSLGNSVCCQCSGSCISHNRPRPQDHDQKSSHKSRIGKITSNASEHLLYDQNAEDSSRSKYPDRHCHRHIKGQEHSGNYRT